MDAIVEMFDQVRSQRPALFLGDERETWIAAVADCISALPTRDQRWAAGVLVANDIATVLPGTPIQLAHLLVLDAVLRATR